MTINNLELIVNPLNKINKRYPTVQFFIISNNALDYINRIKNYHLIVWNQKTYIRELSKCSISIMPLINNDFNEGKCGFKLIQYLNMKKSVIGSGVGINNKLIERNGIITNTEKEWENAFEELLFNKDKYFSCVQNIEKKFF